MQNIGVFELKIIYPTSVINAEIEWIEIESPTGSFIVGPGHAALISIVKHLSKVTYKKKDQAETVLAVQGGVFRVIENKATLLLDS
jgi:F0F1-type ATP synthase epsilon subunit